MLVHQNGSFNRRSTDLVTGALMSGLSASNHRDSRPKEDLNSTVLDQIRHPPGHKQMGNSSFNRSLSAFSLSQVDLTPPTEWDESRKKKKGLASTKNEMFAENGDGKDRPSEKKARAASLWKAVIKEVMGSNVHQPESELRVKNKNNFASHIISAPAADLSNAKLFPKGGDESAEPSPDKKARTTALWKAIKKEVMGSSLHQVEPESRKKNKTNLTSPRTSGSESILSIVPARPKEGDENTERPSEKKARASPLWKIVKKDIMGSSVHQIESESLRKSEVDRAAEISAENPATAESGSKDDGEQADRLLERKARVSALWNKVTKKEMMGLGVNNKQGLTETLNNSSRGLSSSNRSLMKKARQQSSLRDLSQPQENRINTEGLEETKSHLPREDKKRASTKSKRVDRRLLLKKALSAPLMNQENALPVVDGAQDFADGNIIDSENIETAASEPFKSFERLVKEVESTFSGDNGEETLGDSRLVRKSPDKNLRRRSTSTTSMSMSNPRRGRRSHYRKAISDPSLTVSDEPREDTEDKHRSFRGEDSREEEATARSSRDPVKRSEKQQTKREERAPRKGRRSQFRKAGSDPDLGNSTSWESSERFECRPPEEMEKESWLLRDGDAREVKHRGARDVSKRPSKPLRKGGEGRHARIFTSGRRSQLRRTASDRSSKVVTPMEKLEILLSGHNSTTSIEIFSQLLVPANEVKNEPPLFAPLNSCLNAKKDAEEASSFDDTSLDEDSTICSEMSSEMIDRIDEAPSVNQGRIDSLATDAAAVLRRDDSSHDDFSVDEAETIHSMEVYLHLET